MWQIKFWWKPKVCFILLKSNLSLTTPPETEMHTSDNIAELKLILLVSTNISQNILKSDCKLKFFLLIVFYILFVWMVKFLKFVRCCKIRVYTISNQFEDVPFQKQPPPKRKSFFIYCWMICLPHWAKGLRSYGFLVILEGPPGLCRTSWSLLSW